MLESEPFQTYTGFTGEEVKALCDEYSINFESMKAWYYGYDLYGTELYCPRSVLMAIDKKTFSNYWTQTETYEALAKYIP